MTASWLAAIAAAGQWVLLTAIGIFVSTMIALVIYAIRRGEPGDLDVTPSMQPFGPYSPTGRRGITTYKGVRKLKVFASRETYISMKSLVSGTATREQWAVVVGIQVVLVSFWLIFLGIGLMYLPSGKGWSLAFPGITGLWLFGVFKAQWDDLVAARRKLARSSGRESGERTP